MVFVAQSATIHSTIKLTSQLESMIRKHIALYYAGWLVCDDPAELRQGRFLFMVKDVLVIQVELWIVKGL